MRGRGRLMMVNYIHSHETRSRGDSIDPDYLSFLESLNAAPTKPVIEVSGRFPPNTIDFPLRVPSSRSSASDHTLDRTSASR